jgi:hypothetical protein
LFGECSLFPRNFLYLFEAHSRRGLMGLGPGCCRNGGIREGLAFERSENAGGFGGVSESLDQSLFGRSAIALPEVEGLIQITSGFGIAILQDV